MREAVGVECVMRTHTVAESQVVRRARQRLHVSCFVCEGRTDLTRLDSFAFLLHVLCLCCPSRAPFSGAGIIYNFNGGEPILKY